MKPARINNRSRNRKSSASFFLILFPAIFLFSNLSASNVHADNTAEKPFHRPIQITSRTEPVLDMAVSLDGRYIVYISGDEKPTILWLASADPNIILLPEKLDKGVSVKSSPAISPDNRYVAYVDTNFDVKGDIYLIDRKEDDPKPVRLTDRKTEDGGPCFSADARFLYFHQAVGNRPRELVVLDLKKSGKKPLPIKTGGDAMFCSLSFDNRQLAFVSTRYDASGDIFILNTENNTVRQVTGGPAIDMFPQWDKDSQTLYFSRIGSDTNHDQQLSPEDHSIVCRIDTNDPKNLPYPVTPLNQVSFKPFSANKRIYFLSNQAGVSNCWSVPEDGYIRKAESSIDQLAIADQIKNRIPYDPYTTLLAYVRVIEKFPDDTAICAKAGFAAAGIFQDLNLPTSALGAYRFISSSYKDQLPESILSQIRSIGIEFLELQASETRASEKKTVLEKSLSRLGQIARQYPGIIAAEAQIESVHIILSAGAGLSKMSDALARLDAVIADTDAENSQKAEALFLQARIYDKNATTSQVIDTLQQIIINYPKERRLVDKAVDRIIEQILTDFAMSNRDEKIQKLNLTAVKNQTIAPALAMGALNRIGDLYYETDQLDQAKASYENVLHTYSALTTQTAAARLSLAEILFNEEQFRAAIELYEKEISLRDSSDRIYQLARQGYIRKNISAGEFLFRLGEIPSAQSLFKELIDYDDRIVEAHRGYIKCAAVSGKIETVLDKYRKHLASDAKDPVWLYCNGLCLTYLNDADATRQAKKLIEKSIRFDSSIEYFHQTLGYVHEVLETVYGKSRQLEHALMSYQKAYFLNDHVNNTENSANLELNLGNIYYLMGQYGKAFDFYYRRDQRDIEFSDPKTQIVFLKRFGECAFQNDDIEETIFAFSKAIALIDSHIDPLAPAKAYDQLNQYLKEQIIDPALKIEETLVFAEKTAQQQSGQSLKIADLTQNASPPPSSKWQSYKRKMLLLMEEQEAINKKAFKLSKKYNSEISDIPGNQPILNAQQNLSNLMRRIQTALDFPERLVELKTEISDRLGLAYQENREWKKAAETFEQVFSINQKMGEYSNLVRNRRSAAYNTYQLANSVTGDTRIKLLEEASDNFADVLILIERYGVPEPVEKEKQALIDISVTTSLDAAGATQAAKGFSESQEKRLAQTFISRIQLELGNLKISRLELENQLKNYPLPDKVKEKDLYGVSLLYHRAGLLDNGVGNLAGAFERFAVSAELCLKLKNSMSAALNMTNMASMGLQLSADPSDAGLSASQIKRMQILDKQTVDLISENSDVNALTTRMQYHNQMGLFYFNAAADLSGQPLIPEDAVFRIFLQQDGFRHFSKGLSLFEKNVSTFRRKQLETGTALHLNMAQASLELGDEESAMRHYESALKLSETGVFPDFKWRALIGLNKPGQALDILSMVPLSRAGCAPFEIINNFAPLVFEQLKNGRTEAALSLAENISERERFNRMAPCVRPQNRQEKDFFAKLYPRLDRIKNLKKELSRAEKNNQEFIQNRLENENILLAGQMGANHENLPSLYKNISDKDTRELAVFLAALDRKIAKTAEDLADTNIRLLNKQNKTDKKQNEAIELSNAYENLTRRYQQIAEDAYYDRPLTSPPDFISLMHAEPFDVMDLAEVMTDDDAVARIFHSGIRNTPYAVFLITKEETEAFIADNPGMLKQKIDESIDWITPYIAHENPQSLNLGPSYPYALSAKHLQRCINSKKPFKQKLMSIPQHVPLSGEVSENYDIKPYDAKDTGALLTALSGVNTLLMPDIALNTATVPTQPGDVSRRFFAVTTDDDMRIRLEKLLAGASNLSLSFLNKETPDQMYLAGHLFSIYGCPGVIFINDIKARFSLVNDILASYSNVSGIAALKAGIHTKKSPAAAEPKKITADQALYLGYQGMSKKESAKFAKKNFITYVKNGRSEFDRKNYMTATVMFENAIAVANEISKFDRYLPDLYKYARESAYLSGNMDLALTFAGELADLMADIEPDSKGHAEALLRLGLMHSKKENYEKAISVIQSAVDIMSELKTDEDLIQAFADLGIVLENATNYDSALSRFKHAADLSRTLNQSELMAEQYLNIGRVYDLRLNQYPAAIINYEKARELFTGSKNFEKTAESELNIGRCYRLLGNFSEADQYFKQSLAIIASKAPDQLIVKVKILIEQANNAWFQGRYEQAFKYQRECYRIAKEQRFAKMQVISLNTEGLIWWTLGDYDKALEALNNALTDAKKLKIRQDEVASTLNNIGLIFRDKKEYDKALETFDRAISIDTSIRSKWGLAYDYRNKGLTYLKLDQPEEAASLFDQAYSISSAIGNRINAAKAILGKGDALLVLKDYQNAQKAYQTAFALSETMMIRETQWRSLFGLAKIQITFTKDLKAAENLLRKSIEVIEQLRSDIKIKQLKENFIANKLSVYETLVKLLADQNLPVESFEIAERSRARNFIDLLGGHQIGFASDKDNILFRKQQIIRSEIETTELLLGLTADKKERIIYEKSLTDLQHDLQNIMIDMQLQNPQLASMVSVPPVDTEKLIRFMEPKTALLSYYLLENEVFCWILRSDAKPPEKQLQLIRIPVNRKVLEKQILAYRRIIQNLEPYEKHAFNLYKQLFEPLTRHLEGVHTIGISPHGSLHYLSFATLFTGESFLLEDYSLFYVPSAAVLEYTLNRRLARPYRSPKVLAIGNPDLGDPILDLPFAEQEVGAIKWDFPDVTVLTRENATEKWVIDNISVYDIIHIASHGEFNTVNPLLSAIKLAASPDKNFTKSDFDGNLDAGEIFGLKINADLVFLSACQTGLGKINAGDDVVGLNRSFFYAGTHTVVSSLWRVSDVSTAVMIKTFYRLYMNRNKADCLKQAALHVKTRYPHPGYWGAFTLVGDYY